MAASRTLSAGEREALWRKLSDVRGAAPEDYRRLDSRLHLVPRYRQRLAFVPFNQGRPVWVDDPHFKLQYHVRHTALPRPGEARHPHLRQRRRLAR